MMARMEATAMLITSLLLLRRIRSDCRPVLNQSWTRAERPVVVGMREDMIMYVVLFFFGSSFLITDNNDDGIKFELLNSSLSNNHFRDWLMVSWDELRSQSHLMWCCEGGRSVRQPTNNQQQHGMECCATTGHSGCFGQQWRPTSENSMPSHRIPALSDWAFCPSSMMYWPETKCCSSIICNPDYGRIQYLLKVVLIYCPIREYTLKRLKPSNDHPVLPRQTPTGYHPFIHLFSIIKCVFT